MMINFHDAILLPSLSSTLSLYHLVSTFIGILLTFSPMHFLGFNLMQRRIPDFPVKNMNNRRSDPWAGLIASCGSFYPMVLTFISFMIFFFMDIYFYSLWFLSLISADYSLNIFLNSRFLRFNRLWFTWRLSYHWS